MKEITIHYKTDDEMTNKDNPLYDLRSRIAVLVDGKPIERLKRFSIDFDVNDIEPTYCVEQYMDFPDNDQDYTI